MIGRLPQRSDKPPKSSILIALPNRNRLIVSCAILALLCIWVVKAGKTGLRRWMLKLPKNQLAKIRIDRRLFIMAIVLADSCFLSVDSDKQGLASAHRDLQ